MFLQKQQQVKQNWPCNPQAGGISQRPFLMQLRRQGCLLNELNQRQIEPTKPIQLTKQIKFTPPVVAKRTSRHRGPVEFLPR